MAKYLYNNIELPALPDWDKTAYPYVYIGAQPETYNPDTVFRYWLYISASPFFVKDNDKTAPNTTILVTTFFTNDSLGYWKEGEIGEMSTSSVCWTPIWSNYDMYYTDELGGTLCLPASYPIDAETGEEIHDYEIVEPVPTLTARDLYKKIGGQLVKHDLYKKVNGKLVKVDGYAVTLMAQEPEQPEAEPLPAVGTSLEDCTWEQISAISAAGKAAEYFSVGDTKSVYLKGTVGTLALDTTLYVYILGFDHNSEIEGKGITFGTFKNPALECTDQCLSDAKYANSNDNGNKYFNMNHWGASNYGGWAACDMRYDILGSTDVAPSGYGAAKTTSAVGYAPSDTCATNPVENTLMAALPAELRAVMKPMTKYTDNIGGTSGGEAQVTATIDYLPLLSEFEIYGACTYANSYEKNKQKQYDYFSAGNSKIKYYYSVSKMWWQRSHYIKGITHFCCVDTAGSDYGQTAKRSYGIAPIFLV